MRWLLGVIAISGVAYASPFSDADCQKLFGPANISAKATKISDQFALCELVQTKGDPTDSFARQIHTLRLVGLPQKKSLGAAHTIETEFREGLPEESSMPGDPPTALSLEVLDKRLVVTTLHRTDGASMAIYRPTTAGLVDVLDLAESCDLNKGSKTDLDATCDQAITHYRWTGTKYVKR